MIGKCKECENYGYNPNCGGYCFEFDYHTEPNSVHECCEKEGEMRGNEYEKEGEENANGNN